jgi:Immunoglobulin-like domain of bacterial spore germination
MRLTRQSLVAGTLVLLAAGIGTTAAITTRSAPTAPLAAQPAGPAAVAAPSGSTTSTPSTTSTTTSTPRDGAGAVAAAREFLARELGMTNLVATPFRFTDARTGEVGFRHKFGEGGRVLPQTGPPAVVVRLYRLPAGWWVLGVRGRSIQVDEPVRLQRISSPLTVTGKASAYEGTVYVKVTQDQPGRDLVLGQGFVTGSGDANLGPFAGRIDFRRPTAEAGWVIFYDAANDGSDGILQATAVRVRFAVPAPAPRILTVTTSPRLRKLEGDWLELPKGAGTVQLSVKALNAERVRFVLTPTGTGTAPFAKLLGEDRDARDGFTLTWHYGAGDAPSAHLSIQAVGPGGKAEELLGIAHPA